MKISVWLGIKILVGSVVVAFSWWLLSVGQIGMAVTVAFFAGIGAGLVQMFEDMNEQDDNS